MDWTLQRIDASHNVRRFYRVLVLPNLFGEFTVMREWGRIGHPGTVRSGTYASEAEAVERARLVHAQKIRRGYRSLGDVRSTRAM